MFKQKQIIDDIFKEGLSEDKNFKKKIISSTTIEKISTEKKPLRVSRTLTETSENQKSEKIDSKMYLKTEEDFTDFESFYRRPSKFKVYLSSRYKGPKLKDQIPTFEESENNVHNLYVRKTPVNITHKRNISETEKETKILNNSNYSNNQRNSFTNIKSQSEKNIFKSKSNSNSKERMDKMIYENSPNYKRKKQSMIPQNIMSPIKYYDDGNSLFENSRNFNKLNKLEKVIVNNDNTTKNISIRNKYVTKAQEEKEKIEKINLNSKKVIKITRISEKEEYTNPQGKNITIEKNKFNGLLNIIEGVNNYHKKQAHYETKPKLIKYLKHFAKKEKLK